MRKKKQTRISLVLGSGGARGLTHIGIIQRLEEQGFQIASISGCSMGALVGGIYAAGELPSYRDWVCALRQTDVLRFLDVAFRSSGFIKGDKIIDRLREMVGEHAIEDLPVAFTAVATDIDRQREVWLSKGPLFDAIRASIAVPTVFTPHRYLGMTLLDGGLLNPVPIAPTFRDVTDLTIAVNLNAEPRGDDPMGGQTPAAPPRDDDLRGRILEFLDSIGNNLKPGDDDDDELGMFELVSRSFDTMQNAMSAMKLAAYAPDVLIEVPRDVCDAHEFHRAAELIDIGYRLAEKQLSEAAEGVQPD